MADLPVQYSAGLHQPDHYVKQYLEQAIERIRSNYNSVAETDGGRGDVSFLRFLFRNQGEGDYGFFDNAVKVFTRTDGNSNKLKVYYEWEKEKNREPYLTIHVESDSMTKNFISHSQQEVVAVNEGTGQPLIANIFTPEMQAAVKISIFSKSRAEVRMLRHVFSSVLVESQVTIRSQYDTTFVSFRDRFGGIIDAGEAEEMYRWDMFLGYNYRPLFVGINTFPSDPICDFDIQFNIQESLRLS